MLSDVFHAGPYNANSLHACVREGSVAGKLRETFYCILKGTNGGGKMLLEDLVCVCMCMCVCVGGEG